MQVLDHVDFNLFFCQLLYFTVKFDRPSVFCSEILLSFGICNEIQLSFGVLQQDPTAPLVFCDEIRQSLGVLQQNPTAPDGLRRDSTVRCSLFFTLHQSHFIII
jgi:hypothetical protein